MEAISVSHNDEILFLEKESLVVQKDQDSGPYNIEHNFRTIYKYAPSFRTRLCCIHSLVRQQHKEYA